MYLLAVGAYIITSYIFFKFPTLLREKKKTKFECKHISHRGGAGENFENTLTAFHHAVEQGTQMLELDCQLTKDKQVVVLHDRNLSRLTGVDENVDDLNYVELPSLKTCLPLDFDPGKSFCGAELADRKIPLLSDVFKSFRTIPINIDIKQNSDILINSVNELIIQYDREDLTVWGNTSDEVVHKCYKTNKNVNLFFSMKRVLHLLLLFYTGLLPFFPLKETHLEIFLPSIYFKYEKVSPDAHVYLSPMLLRVVHILLMRRTLFSHLSKRGIQTYFWVLNEEEEYKTAFKLGATGVMTDYPTKLNKFLIEFKEGK